MATKICMRCGKGAQMAFSRSHSNIASKRKQRPNFQRVTLQGKRMVLCASCVRLVARSLAR